MGSDHAHFLMCRPNFYAVNYVINPWMAGNVGRSVRRLAEEQWDGLRRMLSSCAEVSVVDAEADLPDMCFTANAGLVYNDWFVPARHRHRERVPEVPFFRSWAENAGFRIHDLAGRSYFEGEGDALFQPGEALLWGGYGFRTSLQVYRELSRVIEVRIKALRLVDPRFYHLDTCFCPLPGGKAVYFPHAFDTESLAEIRGHFEAGNRFEVSPGDALQFVCNAIVVGDVFISNSADDALRGKLEAWGFEVRRTSLTQFILAGGAAKCLALNLDNKLEGRPRNVAEGDESVSQRTLEVHGHLLDSGLLNEALDRVVEQGGSFEIQSFDPGSESKDESRVSMDIFAPNQRRLERIAGRILQLGAQTAEEPGDAITENVNQEGVAPSNFYSTTLYPTEVRINGEWVLAEQQRMDATIVVETEKCRATCVLLRELRVGDHVVCGLDGIRVRAEREVSVHKGFAFMSSDASSERRAELAIDRIAWSMKRIREQDGRIVVLAGPVVVHTGGAPYLEEMIREGYVSALLGGNAVAVHDIEQSMYGTSLGLDLERGVNVPGGHRNHIRAINEVRRCGSIVAAVEQGLVSSGIMYECVQNSVPFCLAGSIRDDGPLPDTEMDLIVAQQRYAQFVQGSDMILMLASMLHSIGVGNMTPSTTQLICVDINPAVAAKLSDRGSISCTTVVTDVGLFLSELGRRLGGH